jgi:hypothetical protein
MLPKDLFEKCVAALEATDEFQMGIFKTVKEINHKYRTTYDVGSVMYPTCEDALLQLLEYECGDTEGNIAYFCYDLEYGRLWEPGMITDENGEDIKLATVDDLWELLNK